MVITFESFDIEPNAQCQYDYLAIYDGNSTSDPLLLLACGASIPPIVQSSGHIVLVQFHSDSVNAHYVSWINA